MSGARPVSVKAGRDVTVSSDRRLVPPREAAALYIELGWGTSRRYTVERMRRSLRNCDIVVSARNNAGELVGLARALSDFAIETKILDIVIVPEYQGQGIGRVMMRVIASLAPGTNVYCETEPRNFGFVRACGYVRRPGLTVFVKRGGEEIRRI